MKRLSWVLLLALLVPSFLGAQVATDTVLVTIEGDLAEVTIQVPDTTLSIGDSIQYTAITVDSDGDPVTTQLTWTSSQPQILSIDAQTEMAVALQKSPPGVPIAVSVRAEKIGALHLASFRDGELNWMGNDTIDVGATLQYCAYLVDPDNYLLAEDPGPPTCPIVFVTRPEPPTTVFASIPRVRPLKADRLDVR